MGDPMTDPMTDPTTDPTDAADLEVVTATVEVGLEVTSLLITQGGELEPLDPILPAEEAMTPPPGQTMTCGIPQVTARVPHTNPDNLKD